MRFKALIYVIWFLNLVDAVLTDHLLRFGAACGVYEVNPLMSTSYRAGRASFFEVKIGMVTGALALIAHLCRNGCPRFLYWMLVGITAVYVAAIGLGICVGFTCHVF